MRCFDASHQNHNSSVTLRVSQTTHALRASLKLLLRNFVHHMILRTLLSIFLLPRAPPNFIFSNLTVFFFSSMTQISCTRLSNWLLFCVNSYVFNFLTLRPFWPFLCVYTFSKKSSINWRYWFRCVPQLCRLSSMLTHQTHPLRNCSFRVLFLVHASGFSTLLLSLLS